MKKPKKLIIPIVILSGLLVIEVSYLAKKALIKPEKPKVAQKAKASTATKPSKSITTPTETSKPVEASNETPPEPIKEPVTASTNETTQTTAPIVNPVISPVSNAAPITNVSGMFATTQYSHTENGHKQGQTYNINTTTPILTKENNNSVIRGQVSRDNIGREQRSVTLTYELIFNTNGQYQSGNVSSTGYITPTITLETGKIYTGQSIEFITTTQGNALSGSIVYPIHATITLN